MEPGWCAAKQCPWPSDCAGYIKQNGGNPEVRPLTACCKVLCGASAREAGMLALQCGGASLATAWAIVFYFLILFGASASIVLFGSFLRLKTLLFWVTVLGTTIFTTRTGVFVTYLTSPFMILQSVPAVGAMSVAVFSFFFSGFQYSIGVVHEGGPLIALVTTSYPIWTAILKAPGDGYLRDGSRISLAMLVLAFVWVLHSVSYRILGYRVEWRHSDATRRRGSNEHVNMCYLLGAAQGHPTWCTPVGQFTSVVQTALAWKVWAVVRNELENQQCRADWVFRMMMYVPPPLILSTVCYNLHSALRSREIRGLPQRDRRSGFWAKAGHFVSTLWQGRDASAQERDGPSARRGEYPGLNSYKGFFSPNRLKAYKQAVALHRRGRNSYFIEEVPEDRLDWQDKVIGFLAWLLATLGLVMAAPVFFPLCLVATVLGNALEALPSCAQFQWCVRTTVTEGVHQKGAAQVLEDCYVGENLPRKSERARTPKPNWLTEEAHQRYINLPYLLDNISHEELHVVLN